jgi:diguanylate cyclase (GGDEF)-like protein/PAS domain S-box-containing protein
MRGGWLGARFSNVALVTGWDALRPFGLDLKSMGLRSLIAGFQTNIQSARGRKDELLQAVRRLDVALQCMSQGIVMYDADRRLVVCNEHACELFGVSPSEIAIGMTLREVLAAVIAAGGYANNDIDAAEAEFDALISRGEPVNYLRQISDGRTVAVSHRPALNGGWVSTFEDVTERRRTEQRIEYLLKHDPLTSLANEPSFVEALQSAIAARRSDEMIAVLCVNLARFKLITDTLGRGIGDSLLRAMAGRLNDCVRDGGTLARLDGEEFAIVRRNIDGPATAEILARRLVAACDTPFTINGHDLEIKVDIGIAMVPIDADNADAALKCADIALHRARNDGLHGLRFFAPAMDAMLQIRRTLDLELREALLQEQFLLYYQPVIDLSNGEICGFEALLRWNRGPDGVVAPDGFLSVAEDSGLTPSIGEWVLRRACADAMLWPLQVRVAVNLSATQFRVGDLYSIVVSSLEAANLPASRLELEITETILMQDTELVAATLQRLRALGVRIVMDDFGTAYSSLAYLRSFPFDKIKIDQSFVRDVADQPDSLAIVRAAIGLGRDLAIATTAEGIETRRQLDRVRAEGCKEGQGYLISPPLPVEQVGELIVRWNAERAALFATGDGADLIPQFVYPMAVFSFADVVQAVNDIVIVTTADLDPPGPKIVYVNPAFTRLTGYATDEVIGLTPRILQGPGTNRASLDVIGSALRAGLPSHQKVLNFAKCGAPYWLDLRISPLRDLAGKITHFVAVERDVTLDKRRLEELEYIADRDTLTGIPNRRALMRSMKLEAEAAMARGQSSDPTGLCLAMIDVDHFKQVNDGMGHAVGDAVLFGVADLLAENVRRPDLLGRIGGEEFAVCMPGITLQDAKALADRLCRVVAGTPLDTPAGPTTITVSIGVARFEPGGGVKAMMEQADAAMYAAKRAGRNRVRVFRSRAGASA